MSVCLSVINPSVMRSFRWPIVLLLPRYRPLKEDSFHLSLFPHSWLSSTLREKLHPLYSSKISEKTWQMFKKNIRLCWHFFTCKTLLNADIIFLANSTGYYLQKPSFQWFNLLKIEYFLAKLTHDNSVLLKFGDLSHICTKKLRRIEKYTVKFFKISNLKHFEICKEK